MSDQPTTTNSESAQSTPTAVQPHGSRKAGARWQRPILVAAIILLAGGAVWYWGVRQSAPGNDLDRLQGDWQITVGGRDTPNIIRVTGDRWQYFTVNNTGNTFDGKAYTLTVNESADPREINLELLDEAGRFKGPKVRMHGIYSLSSDLARVALVPATEPRPTTLDNPDTPPLELRKVQLETPGQSRR